MFEKESEEWFEKLKQAKVPYTNENVNKQLHKAFKDGAEFGYNKANELHYVKDCLPPKSISRIILLQSICRRISRNGILSITKIGKSLKKCGRNLLPKDGKYKFGMLLRRQNDRQKRHILLR